MEVSNRFDLLASLSVDDETIESSTIEIHLHEQKQDIQQPTTNFWEIPEYVEKPIPCSSPLVSTEETPKSVGKIKLSGQKKKVKATVDNPAPGEEISSMVKEVHTEPKPSSSCPPQPYKFKPALANHRNEIKPKFDRRNNVLPKHTSVRGNSKSCMHQI